MQTECSIHQTATTAKPATQHGYSAEAHLATKSTQLRDTLAQQTVPASLRRPAPDSPPQAANARLHSPANSIHRPHPGCMQRRPQCQPPLPGRRQASPQRACLTRSEPGATSGSGSTPTAAHRPEQLQAAAALPQSPLSDAPLQAAARAPPPRSIANPCRPGQSASRR